MQSLSIQKSISQQLKTIYHKLLIYRFGPFCGYIDRNLVYFYGLSLSFKTDWSEVAIPETIGAQQKIVSLQPNKIKLSVYSGDIKNLGRVETCRYRFKST